MNYHKLLSLFGLVCAAAGFSPCALASGKSVLLTVFRDERTGEKMYYVQEDVIAATPVWKPELGDPPLRPSDAIRISRDRLKTMHTEAEGIEVGDVQIARAYIASAPDRWYYAVSLTFTMKARPLDGRRTQIVVVLMDGSLVEPLKLPGSTHHTGQNE